LSKPELPWSILIDALYAPLQQVNANKALLAKINFPRESLIVSGVYQMLFKGAIKLGILLLVVPFFGVHSGWGGVLIPVGLLSADVRPKLLLITVQGWQHALNAYLESQLAALKALAKMASSSCSGRALSQKHKQLTNAGPSDPSGASAVSLQRSGHSPKPCQPCFGVFAAAPGCSGAAGVLISCRPIAGCAWS
jgi:hypothetical protein